MLPSWWFLPGVRYHAVMLAPLRQYLLPCAAATVMCIGCKTKAEPTPAESSTTSAVVASVSAEPPSKSSAAPVPVGAKKKPVAPDPKRYLWLANDGLEHMPDAVDTLENRFPVPPDYRRIELEKGSFGEWLRGLPMAAPGTPVVNHKGEEVLAGDYQHLAGVVALDVGKASTQTSTDIVLRLHGEWLLSQGKIDQVVYRAATGTALPFSRWLQGDRVVPAGAAIQWQRKGKPSKPTHPAFRAYIEAVYNWSNTVSFGKESKVTPAAEVRPGDFLLHKGKPNHAVVVLDMAKNNKGTPLALLGRALSPAQSFYVVGLGKGYAWYYINPDKEQMLTPGTEPFEWGNLRRLPEGAEQTESSGSGSALAPSAAPAKSAATPPGAKSAAPAPS